MRRWTAWALAAAVTVGAPGLIRAADMGSMDMGQGEADQAFGAAMHTMMKTMAAKTTGRPDADFATLMIPHHQGAIDMAKVELRYGRDPELRELAASVVAAQEKEIALMKAWLARHGG